MVDWLAGKRVKGTSSERTTGTWTGLPSGSVGGWKLLGRTSIETATNPVTVSNLADKRYLMVLTHGINLNAGTNLTSGFRLNGDTSDNYAFNYQFNNGTNTTANSNTWGFLNNTGGYPVRSFAVTHIANKSDSEKLCISNGMSSNNRRTESVTKWANATDSVDEFNFYDVNPNSMASGSEAVVLGWDPSDTHTDSFWEELDSVTSTGSESGTWTSNTFTPKKYLWIQTFFTGCSSDPNFRFGTGGTIDTGSNYTYNYAINGASDSTATTTSLNVGSTYTGIGFCNTFIVNASGNEKLIIHHVARQDSTGQNAPSYRFESGGKWANNGQIDKVQWYKSVITFGAGCKMKIWGAD